MEHMLAALYLLVSAVVWRLTKGWQGEDTRFAAALLWPLTMATFAGVGVLLVALLFLAFLGYLYPWLSRPR